MFPENTIVKRAGSTEIAWKQVEKSLQPWTSKGLFLCFQLQQTLYIFLAFAPAVVEIIEMDWENFSVKLDLLLWK